MEPSRGSCSAKKMNSPLSTVPESSAAERTKLNFDHHWNRFRRNQYSVGANSSATSHNR